MAILLSSGKAATCEEKVYQTYCNDIDPVAAQTAEDQRCEKEGCCDRAASKETGSAIAPHQAVDQDAVEDQQRGKDGVLEHRDRIDSQNRLE